MSPKCCLASLSEMQYCETVYKCLSTPINANVAERLRNCLQSNIIPVRLRTLASGKKAREDSNVFVNLCYNHHCQMKGLFWTMRMVFL